MSKYHYSIMRDPTIKKGLRTSSKTDRGNERSGESTYVEKGSIGTHNALKMEK